MSDQLKKIQESSDYIKKNFPKRFKPEIALIADSDLSLPGSVKIAGKVDQRDIPNFNDKKKHSILFAVIGKKDVLILHGRNHYYDGVPMRELGHVIYVLKYLGIKKLISFDEVGHLDPRFRSGELALIYDHINLMGDNPLIGKNEPELGIRFPDMSNAYDKELFEKIKKVFKENIYNVNDSILMAISGPQSETDAEARFYRDTGSDVVGYSMVPENITAVHCGIKFAGIGLITRGLVADIMMEDQRSDKQKIKDQKDSFDEAEKKLGKILKDIIEVI